MMVLNFAHPLTGEQLAQVARLTNQSVDQVIDVPVQIDPDRPLAEQIVSIVDEIEIKSQELQTRTLLVNPPGYAPAAVTLLAELHGRMGYFPAVLWVQPVPGSTPPTFRVVQVVNLQALRDAARIRRTNEPPN